jgi:hypothetical protein
VQPLIGITFLKLLNLAPNRALLFLKLLNLAPNRARLKQELLPEIGYFLLKKQQIPESSLPELLARMPQDATK